MIGEGFYTPGQNINIQLIEFIDVHRFERVDLWVIVELPNGDLLYKTELPLFPFVSESRPFLSSLESSNHTHQILDFEVQKGMGGDYVIYAFFNQENEDLSSLFKTLRSNVAVAKVTLRNE